MTEMQVAPDANRNGVPLSGEILGLASQVGMLAQVPLRIKTGSNHPKVTDSGFLSDHASGNAIDVEPADEAEGDRIAAAALVVAGVPGPKAEAMARAGGLWTVPQQGGQVQVAWKTYEGGDHHYCVHIGIEGKSDPTTATVATRRRTGVPPEEAAPVELHSPGAYDRRPRTRRA